VVYAERSAAEPGQVCGSRHQDSEAVTGCSIAGDHRWSRPDCSRGDEGVGCHSGSTTVLRQAHIRHDAIVHLPCAGELIRHLLLTDLAQTLVCSLILSRIDYCNVVLHTTPSCTMQKRQQVQNNAARLLESYFKHQNDCAPRRYCMSCIGCRWSSASCTSWPC